MKKNKPSNPLIKFTFILCLTLQIPLVFIIGWINGRLSPDISEIMGTLFIFSLFVILPGIFLGVVYRKTLKEYRKYKIIMELIHNEEYKDIVISNIEEIIRQGKYTHYYYVYHCRDIKGEKIYKSDRLKKIDTNLSIGDIVHLYKSKEEPDIYWIDLTKTGSTEGIRFLDQKEMKIGNESINKVICSIAYRKKSEFQGFIYISIFVTGFLLIFSSIMAIIKVDLYYNGVRTTGKMLEITAINKMCGYKHPSKCTRFTRSIALIEYKHNYNYGISYPIWEMKPLYKDGYNQDSGFIKEKQGDLINIVVNKDLLHETLIIGSDRIELADEITFNLLFWLSAFVLSLTGLITSILLNSRKSHDKRGVKGELIS